MSRTVTLTGVLAGLLALSAPAFAEQVFIDLKTLGTHIQPTIEVEDVILSADDVSGSPTTVYMLNLNGLGVSGGASDTTTDNFEALHFQFATLVKNAGVHVGLANNLDADGFLGEGTIEAFIGTTSLGVLPIDDTGWKNVNTMFGVEALTGFTVKADVDGNRIDAMRYGTYFDQMGVALPGTNGSPSLTGSGYMLAGETLILNTTSLLENTSATLVVGFSNVSVPFKGGVLVPSPDLIIAGLPTGPLGSVSIPATWPAGVPAGVEIFAQTWLADGAGVAGFAASNGMRITTP